MLEKISIGLLSSLGNCFLAPVIRELEKLGYYPAAIILDGVVSEATKKIAESRLLKTYVVENLTDLNLPHTPTYFVKNHNSSETLTLLHELNLNYLANAGTPRILKAPLLNSVAGILNCHPGLLPAYRGCTCVEWSIYNGDPVAATSHFMNEGIDDGPVLISEILAVEPFEEYLSIRTRMLTHQAAVLARSIEYTIKNNFSLQNPPTQNKNGKNTYYKPIPDDKFQALQQKIARGEYKSQKC